MKHIRLLMVDNETKEPIPYMQYIGKNGNTLPAIAGMDVVMWQVAVNGRTDWMLATCPDGSQLPEAGVVELTFSEWADLYKTKYDEEKAKMIQMVYAEAIKKREALVDPWYHSSEIARGAKAKAEEASAAAAANNDAAADAAAPNLAAEAKVRGITTKALATKVLAAWQQNVIMDRRLAGYRGYLVDLINSRTWDGNNPVGSMNALLDHFEFEFQKDWLAEAAAREAA